MASKVVGERLCIEMEFLRERDQVFGAKLALVREEQVVHRPECVLRRRRLGCLGRKLCARVYVVERKMAPHIAKVAEVGREVADDLFGLSAVRAFEVAVFNERDRRVFGSADVVALAVDGIGEIDDGRGLAEQRAGVHVRGSRGPSSGRATT